MQDALPIVVVAVVVIAAVAAVVTLLAGRGAYDHIGRGGISFDRETAKPGPPGADPFRDEEIRQMLEARNARRAVQGDESLDVEAELAALTRPARNRQPDDPAARAAVVAEVRAFVESRNARRVARGKSPLDVEAEIERRLSGADG